MVEAQQTNEPVSRLTRICAAMTEQFDMHPEHRSDDKCIVFLDDEEWGGLVLHGYEDDTEAMTHLIIHLQAIFRSSGKRLDLMFMDEEGIDRVDG